MSRAQKDVLCLFDVDGTLTPARKSITPEMKNFMARVSEHVDIATVGGSDMGKQVEQMGPTLLQEYKFCFSENGLVGYKDGIKFHENSLKARIGEERLALFVSEAMKLINEFQYPVKTSNFVEVRMGMINVAPIGRDCTYEQRLEFFEYDKIHHVRDTMIARLKAQFPEFAMVVGGQISFDVFPPEWSKAYCLQFCAGYQTIHFFGDKTAPGGNDYDIFTDPRVVGHTVTGPDNTMALLAELFDVPIA
ncbi:putative Phosphomannomutase [Paratrimastix pyriformis]|uniref:Phosphomannomutase n=1 Tax=Paratrimastix pyriformis TaxID=342808 RepID=A0ABQ8UYW3_9EUKA|nr:putative Phosphomannomutase [Paratrimastix pyriformis]